MMTGSKHLVNYFILIFINSICDIFNVTEKNTAVSQFFYKSKIHSYSNIANSTSKSDQCSRWFTSKYVKLEFC